MSDARNLTDLLDRMLTGAPGNAISLRSASAQIVSAWIKSGRPYPDERIDGFVYIESSIEDSITRYSHDAVQLEKDTEDAYHFHINRFYDLVKVLRSDLED
jgi:hypothetical protein